MVTWGKVFKGDELAVTGPLLIIEVLSPITQGYDRRNKFMLYRSLAPPREYALIDPDTHTIDVHVDRQRGVAAHGPDESRHTGACQHRLQAAPGSR
jgi:Uma2 family endonuclease